MRRPTEDLQDLEVPQTAGGCCVAPVRPEENGVKHILVYPYTDPSIPFEELAPDQITFYFHVTNRTGHATELPKDAPTCAASCQGCYFKTLDDYSVDPALAQTVARDFRTQGYDMGLVTADSFSDLALKRIGQAGSAFRYDVSEQNGNAWTNGKQLSDRQAFQRLDKGWQLGYGVITISLYGAALPHPMKGIPQNRFVEGGIKNIRAWNKARFPEGGGYKIIGTQLISKQTCTLEDMRTAAQYCLENGIQICRFNAFANFLNQEEMQDKEMSADDIRRFWQNLALLQEEFKDTSLQFGVSEDMSATGIEACIPYFNPKDGWDKFDPENPYWCRAGYRLFSVNGVKDETSGKLKLVITGCVDNWSKAPIGEVVFNEEKQRYEPRFKVEKIEAIRAAVTRKDLSTCWGGVGNPNGREDTRGHAKAEVDAALFSSSRD